jgi:hypothetical protein
VAPTLEETQGKQPIPKSRNSLHNEKRERGWLPRSPLSCTGAEDDAESGALRRSNFQETSSVLGRRNIDLCIAPPRQLSNGKRRMSDVSTSRIGIALKGASRRAGVGRARSACAYSSAERAIGGFDRPMPAHSPI